MARHAFYEQQAADFYAELERLDRQPCAHPDCPRPTVGWFGEYRVCRNHQEEWQREAMNGDNPLVDLGIA